MTEVLKLWIITKWTSLCVQKTCEMQTTESALTGEEVKFRDQKMVKEFGTNHITGVPGVQFSSVQSLSYVRLCNPMDCSMPGLPVHHQLLEFTQTHVHWVGDAIQPSHPLSSPSPPAFNLSQHQCISQWVRPKYWSFSFSISPSNEYSGLIFFRMDCLDLPAVQRTLMSLLQHHSTKASILQCSAFFMVQVSHWQMTIGKTIALNRWTFIGKVMALLFHMLSAWS